MKKKRLPALLCAMALLCMTLCACSEKKTAPTHEVLTVVTECENSAGLEKEFNKVYPEVRLRFVTREEGADGFSEEGDIYALAALPEAAWQKNCLVDLSGYDFSARYAPSRLSECSTGGSVYLLPGGYTVLGIYYNKTLFEEYGFAVPDSFAELEELLPDIRAAGVEVSTTVLESFESAFQYLFDLGDTMFLRTPEGLDFTEKFFDGIVGADDAWESTIEYMQRWIDLGVINGDFRGKSAEEALSHFTEGNTAFLITGEPFRFTQTEDGGGDRYGLLPWLSPDGTNNRYITETTGYFAMSSELEAPDNRQKLEDALKFMEFISTAKGQQLLSGGDPGVLSPLSDPEILWDENYGEIVKQLKAGFGAPSAVGEWETIADPVGAECVEWYTGAATGRELIDVMNRALKESLEGRTGLTDMPRLHREIPEEQQGEREGSELCMSKYSPLWQWVSERDGDGFSLTFEEVEALSGCPLDHSFLTCKKELAAYGWQVGKISMKEQKVSFEKL